MAIERTPKPGRPRIEPKSGPVRVWSEVGVTIPVGDTTAHIKFAFGHERFAKNDSTEELKRVAALIDEFNEEELDRRITKYRNMIARISESEEDDDSVRSRAQKKVR